MEGFLVRVKFEESISGWTRVGIHLSCYLFNTNVVRSRWAIVKGEAQLHITHHIIK